MSDRTSAQEQEGAKPDGGKRRVLFVCTGNIYRSRFAEAIFNHHAAQARCAWSACSRGLEADLQTQTLSPIAARALEMRQIALQHTAANRCQLCEADLEAAELVIALYEAEHRPMFAERFPAWEARIRYWNVADLNEVPSEEALAAIEKQVLELLAELQSR